MVVAAVSSRLSATAHSPALDRCVVGCGNMVRTDAHAHQLRARADRFTQQALHQPQPIGSRLLTTADRLRSLADAHDRTRITSQEPCP
ncbi:hypothetical protein [Streptomyces sp. NPDC003006]